MKKLSKTQQELLDAMKNGVRVVLAPYGASHPSYVYRQDNFKSVTSAAHALENKGIIKRFGKSLVQEYKIVE